MECVHELLCSQIGLFHLESDIDLTNIEQAIIKKYNTFKKEIKHEKLATLSSDFYDVNSDIGLFHLFRNAFEYATRNEFEACSDIKKIFFEMLNCFEKIVIYCDKIVVSIEAVTLNYISFYQYLMQDCDYEKVAYVILKSLNRYQTINVFVPLEQMAAQTKSIKSITEEMVLKYTPFQEKFETGHIKKLQKPTFLLQTSLTELLSTKTYVTESFEKVEEAINGRFMMHTVKETHFKSWKNAETKTLFLKCYTNLLGLILCCKDVKSIFEDLLIKFRSMMHEF